MAKLTLRPGVETQRSPTLNEAGISDSQMVRFTFGLPEKQGGWVGFPNLTPLIGTCRGLFGWADFNGRAYLAAGTEQRLQVMSGGHMNDITPLRATSNPAPSVATTAGSTAVTIQDVNNDVTVGDWVYINVQISVDTIVLRMGYYQVIAVVDGDHYTINAPTAATNTVTGGAVPSFTTTLGSATVAVLFANHGMAVNQPFTVGVSTAVGGITLSGMYTVASVVDASHFTIIAGTVATSTATAAENGGNTQIEYLIASGFAVPTALGGWGVGDFGMGDWGTGSSGTIKVPARQWSLFNFGQDLIASPTQGAIYYWAPPDTTTRATVIDPSAPTQNIVVFGMGQAQIIIAAGSSVDGTLYPTLVRWCDSGDFTDWVATVSNEAGSYQIPTGSYVIAGLSIGLGALIWTDVDLWTMSFIGMPFVFSFNRIAISCEPLGVHSVAVIPGNVSVWPGGKGFYRCDGGSVSPLPCSVWDTFFKLIDQTLQSLVCSAVNALFNEVSWYYMRLDGQIGYVRWNTVLNVWDQGVLDRTAWIDLSPVGNPIGCDTSGRLYQHEIGMDADTTPMAWSFTTGFFDLQAGEDFTFVDFLIPDFVGTYTAIQVTLFATDAPNLPSRVYGPFTLTPGTEYLNVRVRGRQLAMKFSGNDLGSEVRLGAVRYRFASAGRR